MTIRLLAFAAILGPVVLAVPTAPFITSALAQDAGAEKKAFMDAQEKLMNSMSEMKPMGKPDSDFVMMMIPHHQGAIDMAQVELKYGKDPMLRKMAQEIIRSQQAEIDKMKKWQQKNGM
jgi:uncharacterized protein (DUF305 family)